MNKLYISQYKSLKKYMGLLAIPLLLIFSLLLVSCDNTSLDDNLDNPNAVTEELANLDLYWNSVQVNFADWWAGNQTPMMHVSRMMAMTWGETYDISYGPSSFNSSWNEAYADLIPDINQMIDKGIEQESWIHVAAGKILKGYVLQMLVDKHGDIPYSQAFQGTVYPSPMVDTDEDVYDAIIALYTDAITDLEKTNIGSPAVDIFYSNDKTHWTTLAHTLLFRAAVNKGDATGITDALTAGVIDEKAEDFVFQYGTNRSNPDSRHPWYSEAYESYSGPYLSNYYMWEMHEEKGISDPRLRYYFKRQDLNIVGEDLFTIDCVDPTSRPVWYDTAYTNAYGVTVTWPFCAASSLTTTDASNAKGYWGRDHGNNDGTPPDGRKRTAYGVYPAGGQYDDGNAATGVFGSEVSHTQNGGTDGGGGDGHQPILMSSHVYFMRAEAALLGLTSEDARTMLETAIRESIASVMSYSAGWASVGDFNGDGVGGVPESRNIEAYVTYVLTAYDAAADDGAKMNIIVKEMRLASWGNGIEPYNAMRRTGHPTEMQGPMKTESAGTFPNLFPYPADFTNLNANAPVRTDMSETVFWDTRRTGDLN